MRLRYVLGKVDYDGSGRADCLALLTWELYEVDGRLRFSACGEVWDARGRDTLMAGQCVDKVAAMFPNDEKAQRITAIWKRWHLNDMRAGSPAQEAFLREHPMDPATYAYPKSHFEVASNYLSANGLNPDGDYWYGHAWKYEPLPAEVIEEIRSW